MALLIVVAAGALLRLLPLIGAGFPLNDGGLFLTMADEVRAAGFALPETTAYNGLGVPFAYPPLAFYAVAVLETVGIDGLDSLRWLPWLASVATIPVVYLIGREVFRSDGMALGTAAFFTVTTGAYEWLVMGGGVTRSPGLLAALAAILLAIRVYRTGGRWLAVGAGLALGITGLLHPQATVFGILSVVLILPFVAIDRRRAVRHLAVIFGVALIVVLPWLLVILARHGPDPLISAASTGADSLVGLADLLRARTSGGHFEVLGIATVLGLVVSGLRGFWLAPAWVVAIAIVDGRAGQLYLALPGAMAVAFMVRDLAAVIGRQWPRVERRAPVAIGAVLFVAAFADSFAAQSVPGTPLRPISSAARMAMTWVVEQTDPDASFVVVSGHHWASDAEAEWFPVLAERRSLATVQGYEWLGAEAFDRQVERSLALPECIVLNDLACIEDWLRDAGDPGFLFLTESAAAEVAGVECCLQLADQVATFRRVEVVHTERGVLVVHLP